MSPQNQPNQPIQQQLQAGVVVICHNHQEYLPQALDSVVMQDYPCKVIALIDDGSNKDVWDSLADKDCKIENGTWYYKDVAVFYHRNPKALGPAAARNVGFALLQDKVNVFFAAQFKFFEVIRCCCRRRHGKFKKVTFCFFKVF